MIQTDPNIFDNLLYYLSHVGKLSWGKFKRTIELLTKNTRAFKPSFYLMSLARLGYIDFERNSLDCVVAPAVLVDIANKDRYVLVGSRTPDFLSEIKKIVASTGVTLDLIPEKIAPTTIILSKLTTKFFTEIGHLGINISSAFSAKLSRVMRSPKLNSFPSIDTPHDIQIEEFDINKLMYFESDQIKRGLYRICRSWGRDIYAIKIDPHLRKVPRDWGQWLVLSAFRKTGLVRYEKESSVCCVRKELYVPLLIDRCATLCSGRPPERNGVFNHYLDVPIGIAFRLAESLYQKLEVI